MTTALRSGIATFEIIRKSIDSVGPLSIKEMLQIFAEEQLLLHKKFPNNVAGSDATPPLDVIDWIFQKSVLVFKFKSTPVVRT
jgi:hypothetical protein